MRHRTPRVDAQVDLESRGVLAIRKEDKAMLNLLWAIAVIFAIMWMLGFALHVTLGGFIHLLLVLAIISVLARIIMGRRIV
jgi:hypothetical protein